jgi:hypothetical protein
MKKGVFWVVTPHGVATQKTPFFIWKLASYETLDIRRLTVHGT